MYARKTRDRWDIETNYGYGWEVEDTVYTRKEAETNLKGYRELVQHYGGMVRCIKRRERI